MQSVLSWAKRNAEGLIAALVGVVCWHFAELITARFAQVGGWSSSALFQGVLGWASIEAGFLFSAYTFLAAGSSPFILAIQKTPAFLSFKSYIIITLYASFLLSGFALILSIAPPDVVGSYIGWLVLPIFISASVWIVLRFLKIVRVFRTIDKASAPEPEFGEISYPDAPVASG